MDVASEADAAKNPIQERDRRCGFASETASSCVAYTSHPAAMPHRLCAICQVQGRFLEDISRHALVEYYRCDECGHVWTHEKANPNSPPEPVTLKPEKRDKAS